MVLSTIAARYITKPIYRALNGVLGRVRVMQSNKIPQVELQEKHIRNLRIVLDRAAFLEHLPKGGVVAEAGVDRGGFSERILSIARPERLHLIDVWSSTRYHSGLEAQVRARFAKEIATGQVRIDLGLSTDVLHTYADHHFDWLYIDTDHGYAVTAQELDIARNKVKPNGIIAGHDYVTGNWNGGVRYGVVEAVHEFCVKYNWELILLTHETDRHLSFAIRAIR
ncbi:MAG: class I SAM-dependent methyltransferase [Flavobacteriales bacterium]|nr:class I SAM-dependent methyltransferase [Flavobacteriales bacterium]